MDRQPVLNVVEERTSGYITRKTLESFLQARYPNVASLDEFHIKVGSNLAGQLRTKVTE